MKNIKETNTSELILESSLQSFFFDKIQNINQKSTRPISNELVYYMSLVLDKFGQSQNLYEEREGKLRDKTLGLKLLKSSELSEPQKKRTLREIGDTALFVCGYFYESLNSKLIDISYYEDVGKVAYRRLDSFIPQAYEVPSFFINLSDRFNCVTNIVSIISKEMFSNDSGDEPYLILSDRNKIKVS